jgi:hypothetical protein
MKEETKYILIGLATLLLIAKCASGGSVVEVNQDAPKPTPTVTKTVTKTQVKTVEKKAEFPDSCAQLGLLVDRLNEAIDEVGRSSGPMQDAGDRLLSAMERQDRKLIVNTTRTYSTRYSDLSSGLSDLVGTSLQLQQKSLQCQQELKP